MPIAQEEPTFAARLTQFREARGLSQKQLAAKVGCSPALISKYENGLRLPRTLERYVRLSEALTVTPADLVGSSPEAGSPESEELTAWIHERARLLGTAQVRALLTFFCAAFARLDGEARTPDAARPEGAQ